MKRIRPYVKEGEEKIIDLIGFLACIKQNILKESEIQIKYILYDDYITDIKEPDIAAYTVTILTSITQKGQDVLFKVVYEMVPSERTKPKKKDLKKKMFNMNYSMRVKRHYDEY